MPDMFQEPYVALGPLNQMSFPDSALLIGGIQGNMTFTYVRKNVVAFIGH